MKIWFLSIVIGVVALTGCSMKQTPTILKYDDLRVQPAKLKPDDFKPIKLVKIPKIVPMKGQLKKSPKYGKKKGKKRPVSIAERIKLAKKKSLVEPETGRFFNSIQVYPYSKGALYKVYASPKNVTDIQLEPGEVATSVSAGDTTSWIVGDSKSGTGDNEVVHIMVKPIQAGLTTNLVINTNLRTYYLELESSEQSYMSSVSWQYPYDALKALEYKNKLATEKKQRTITGLNLNNLRFRYSVKGVAPWKPVRVFDDGSKVYIQFPSGMKQGIAPPLFVLGNKSKSTIVNYRLVRGPNPYYVVDELFAAAELRHGGEPQEVVKILRKDVVWR